MATVAGFGAFSKAFKNTSAAQHSMQAALADSSSSFSRKGYVMIEIQGPLSSSWATSSKHKTTVSCVGTQGHDEAVS